MRGFFTLTLAATLAASTLTGCRRSAPVAIPRPTAYPRIELYPPTYHSVDCNGVALAVNDSAVVDAPEPGWLNLQYPRYGITVALTLTRSTRLDEVMANRRERMARNVGDAYVTVTELPRAVVLKSPEVTLTPLQLLATDSATYVLSGVAMTPGNVNPDSVAPAVEAVETDLIYLLQHL